MAKLPLVPWWLWPSQPAASAPFDTQSLAAKVHRGDLHADTVDELLARADTEQEYAWQLTLALDERRWRLLQVAMGILVGAAPLAAALTNSPAWGLPGLVLSLWGAVILTASQQTSRLFGPVDSELLAAKLDEYQRTPDIRAASLAMLIKSIAGARRHNSLTGLQIKVATGWLIAAVIGLALGIAIGMIVTAWK